MDKHSKLGNCRGCIGMKHQLVFNIFSTGLSTGGVENFFQLTSVMDFLVPFWSVFGTKIVVFVENCYFCSVI